MRANLLVKTEGFVVSVIPINTAEEEFEKLILKINNRKYEYSIYKEMNFNQVSKFIEVMEKA